MPARPRPASESFHASMADLAPAPPSLTASGTGIDSQTLQFSPAAATVACRSAISAAGHARPLGDVMQRGDDPGRPGLPHMIERDRVLLAEPTPSLFHRASPWA